MHEVHTLEYQSYLLVLEKNWSINVVLYSFPLYSLLVSNLLKYTSILMPD
jgi:hypothetical protein